jgi:nucleotide-binding universal stress UspA family protein
MKRILVATDGSEGARRAVDYAAGLASSIKAELLIVNIVDFSLPENLFVNFTSGQRRWLEDHITATSSGILTKAMEDARRMGAITIQLESRSGDTAQMILEIAEEKEADLIVVGKRGMRRVAGMLLGSISQKVVVLAQNPVTVVP